MNDLNNNMVEVFSIGNRPSHTTQVYNMQHGHEVVYGLWLAY